MAGRTQLFGVAWDNFYHTEKSCNYINILTWCNNITFLIAENVQEPDQPKHIHQEIIHVLMSVLRGLDCIVKYFVVNLLKGSLACMLKGTSLVWCMLEGIKVVESGLVWCMLEGIKVVESGSVVIYTANLYAILEAYIHTSWSVVWLQYQFFFFFFFFSMICYITKSPNLFCFYQLCVKNFTYLQFLSTHGPFSDLHR